MDLSSLFPPSNLLQKARGVEEGLRQRRRLGAIGWFGFIFISAIQLSLEISKVGLVSDLLEKGTQAFAANWPLLLLAIAAIFFLLLGTWSTFWLRESRQPFRYTCSIAAFTKAGDASSAGSVAEFLAWLPHDITRLLNERVQRFLFASGSNDGGAEARNDANTGGQHESAIHIHGHYVIRDRAPAPTDLRAMKSK